MPTPFSRWARGIVGSAALALVFATCAVAQMPVCTLLGCSTGLWIRVDHATRKWLPGEYVFEFDADGYTGRCGFRIEAGGPTIRSCRYYLGGDLRAEVSVQDFRPGSIRISGGTPASVLVTVMRSDREIGAAHFLPKYKAHFPNGPACGDPCMVSDTPQVLEVREF
jgi:hypothetical protein